MAGDLRIFLRMDFVVDRFCERKYTALYSRDRCRATISITVRSESMRIKFMGGGGGNSPRILLNVYCIDGGMSNAGTGGGTTPAGHNGCPKS